MPHLTKKQGIALQLFYLFAEVDELIGNLNFILADLDQLCEDPRLFTRHASPLKHYKLLLRSFFYEFSRFEDLFGHFLVWYERQGGISKQERKSLRDQFYKLIEPIVDVRNTMLHGWFSPGLTLPLEIFLLEAAEGIGHALIRQSDGTTVDWKAILSPVYGEKREALFQAASTIRKIWCNIFADLANSAISAAENSMDASSP